MVSAISGAGRRLTGRYQERSYKPQFPVRNGVQLTQPPPTPSHHVIPLVRPVRELVKIANNESRLRPSLLLYNSPLPRFFPRNGEAMALYKDSSYLGISSDVAFDTLHQPGSTTPHSGIYRCENCGDEVASNAGNPLPPQNHRQHNPAKGAIRWRMILYAVQK